jgi:hypothetical protein
MTKRTTWRPVRHPASRTARSSRTSGIEWGSRWGGRITKTVLTLGALAAAITAILSLRPSSDLADSARFTAIRVVSQVPLSEYRQRSAAMVPKGQGQGQGHSLGRRHNRGTQQAELAAASADKLSSPAGFFTVVRHLQPDPTTESQTAASTDTSAAEPSSTDNATSPSSASSSTDTSSTDTSSTDTSSTDTSSTNTSAPSTTGLPATLAVGELSSSVKLNSSRTPNQIQLIRITAKTEAQVDGMKSCLTDLAGCPVAYLIASSALDPKGNPVPAAVAAKRVVTILRDARTTGGPAAPRAEPLGVVVSADLEVVGLRGRPVLLSWSMWQQGGKKRLFGNWLNRTLAFRLLPSSDDDTTSLDLWVPLPRSPGRYFIRVDLTENQSPLASADSQPFD